MLVDTTSLIVRAVFSEESFAKKDMDSCLLCGVSMIINLCTYIPEPQALKP